MIRRLRVILPPVPYLLAIFLFYLVFEGLVLYFEWKAGAAVPLNVRPGVVIPLLAALAFGVYRVVAFHPFYRPEYRAWLERSPWTAGRPLPLGPVALVWEDGVILSLLALLALVDPALDPVRLLGCFLVTYLGFLAIAFVLTKTFFCAYVLAFGLGLVVRLMPFDPLTAFAVAIVLAVVGHLGLRRSLRRFPWELDWLAPVVHWLKSDKIAYEASMPSGCGWPFDKLSLVRMKPSPFELTRREALLIGPLVGWWLYALEGGFADPEDRIKFAAFVASIGIWMLGLSRFVNYVNGYLPPISFLGRLATFRWIIPGYDIIFIAPLCTLVFPLAVLGASVAWGVNAEAIGPICLALGLFITFNMGPDLKRWQLTGRHRVIPTKSNELVKVG